jgi:SAM-dependent methyltransferase
MRSPGLAFACTGCGEPVPVPPSIDGPVRCAACGYRYAWDDGILMLGAWGYPDDYPDELHPLLADVEPRHFWFAGRNRLILSTMREAIGPLEGRSALDVGCGTGFVLAALERAGMAACGLDMNLAGLRYARRRVQGPLLCQDAARVPFAGQFDVVMLCDVIEHTADDSAVLREAGRALKNDGTLVVTVPAYPSLWTAVDEVSGHKRRYTKEELARAMQRAGLVVRLVRYFNCLLFPAQLLQRQFLRRRLLTTSAERLCLARDALRVPPASLNALLRLAMMTDLLLSRALLPFGSSLIALGYRP